MKLAGKTDVGRVRQDNQDDYRAGEPVSYTHLATFHFDKLYTYAVMPDQQNAVKLGSMVLVPFGRGSRARMGVVLALSLIHISTSTLQPTPRPWKRWAQTPSASRIWPVC